MQLPVPTSEEPSLCFLFLDEDQSSGSDTGPVISWVVGICMALASYYNPTGFALLGNKKSDCSDWV